MFAAGGIGEWRGHHVDDNGGRMIGMLKSVYVDTGTDQPTFATVTVGLPTRHRPVFRPLRWPAMVIRPARHDQCCWRRAQPASAAAYGRRPPVTRVIATAFPHRSCLARKARTSTP